MIAHRRALAAGADDSPHGTREHADAPRFDPFAAAHADWLDNFALFMAVKEAHGSRLDDGRHPLRNAIPRRWRVGRPEASNIRLHKLTQCLFFEHWRRERDACRARHRDHG